MEFPIRKTARELLVEVDRELESLKKEDDALQKARADIGARAEALIDLKESLTKVLGQDKVEQRPLPGMRQQSKGTPLGQFLRSTLADGAHKTIDEIGEIAEKTIPTQTKDKSVKRMVNFALFALRRHNVVDRDAEGKWHIKQRH